MGCSKEPGATTSELLPGFTELPLKAINDDVGTRHRGSQTVSRGDVARKVSDAVVMLRGADRRHMTAKDRNRVPCS
ncbi:hypothetical protein D3C73_1407430 [compost metagenome]